MAIVDLQPSEIVYTQLKSLISSGELPPGKIIPSERQLASKMNTTRHAVRNALVRLEEEGLIERRRKRLRLVRVPQTGMAASAVARLPVTLEKTIGLFAAPDFRYLAHAKKEGGWEQNIYYGVLDGALDAGLSTFLISAQHINTPLFASAAPAGLIVTRPVPEISSLATLQATLALPDIPVVVYGDTVFWPECDMALSDHESGAFQLACWLRQKGCRRLLRLHLTAARDQPWLACRDRGFVKACEKFELPVLPPEYFMDMPNAEQNADTFAANSHMVAGMLHRYFASETPVDGIMVISDGIIPRVMAACRILGRIPGKDVLIAGYDNYWQDCPGRRFENTPPAVSVDKSNYQIGRSLAALLQERLAGVAAKEPARKLIAPRLVFFDNG